MDGISNPAVQGFDLNPLPGQGTPVRPGIILLGREGDPNLNSRPSWAVEGSFMAFRYLSQLVPEFNGFLAANPVPGMPPAQGSELLGARLVGRWKSGMSLPPIYTRANGAKYKCFRRASGFGTNPG